MRYVKKIPSTDEVLSERLKTDGWKKLKEPSNLAMATLLSIPFMFINGAVSFIVVFCLNPPMREYLNRQQDLSLSFTIDFSALLFVFAMPIFMAVHELLHACFIPNALKSDKTCWGINAILGFVYTTEMMKKDRFMLISAMPFFVLSILLPFILYGIGLLNGYLILLCIINAMGSCVDCLNMCLVAVQVPKGAFMINNGLETYFK